MKNSYIDNVQRYEYKLRIMFPCIVFDIVVSTNSIKQIACPKVDPITSKPSKSYFLPPSTKDDRKHRKGYQQCTG